MGVCVCIIYVLVYTDINFVQLHSINSLQSLLILVASAAKKGCQKAIKELEEEAQSFGL